MRLPGRLWCRGGGEVYAVRVGYAAAPALQALGRAAWLMQGGRRSGAMGDERGEGEIHLPYALSRKYPAPERSGAGNTRFLRRTALPIRMTA